MYYDRGHHIERGSMTLSSWLHDNDIVSRSDGFEMTATRMSVSRTMSINFLIESVKAGCGPPFCGNSFVRRRELQDF